MKANQLRLPALAVVLLATACVAIGAKVVEQRSKDDNATRAFTITYRDFSGSLAEETGSKGDPDLVAFVSRMSNYKVEFEETPTDYRVTFLLLPYHGRLLNGGGAQYTVNKATGKLKLVERYE